jgi:hypothetical protein
MWPFCALLWAALTRFVSVRGGRDRYSSSGIVYGSMCADRTGRDIGLCTPRFSRRVRVAGKQLAEAPTFGRETLLSAHLRARVATHLDPTPSRPCPPAQDQYEPVDGDLQNCGRHSSGAGRAQSPPNGGQATAGLYHCARGCDRLRSRVSNSAYLPSFSRKALIWPEGSSDHTGKVRKRNAKNEQETGGERRCRIRCRPSRRSASPAKVYQAGAFGTMPALSRETPDDTAPSPL